LARRSTVDATHQRVVSGVDSARRSARSWSPSGSAQRAERPPGLETDDPR
jgi:hypothetical protein